MQQMQQRQITVVLVICAISVEGIKYKVFCVICEIGLNANNSEIIHNLARFMVHERL